MMKKEINIDGKLVPFKASAAVPRIYRMMFGRDILKDLQKLGKTLAVTPKGEIPTYDLETFENAAYVMAKHADPSQPNTPEEWLDQFDTFSIYEVLPEIMDLWHLNVMTEAESKKKSIQAHGN